MLLFVIMAVIDDDGYDYNDYNEIIILSWASCLGIRRGDEENGARRSVINLYYAYAHVVRYIIAILTVTYPIVHVYMCAVYQKC